MSLINQRKDQSAEPGTDNHTDSDDPEHGQIPGHNPRASKPKAPQEPAPGDTHDQPTAEEFGERGMGMAAKE